MPSSLASWSYYGYFIVIGSCSEGLNFRGSLQGTTGLFVYILPVNTEGCSLYIGTVVCGAICG